MKSFLLVTVQHTGTNAIRNLAKTVGYQDIKRVGVKKIEQEGVAYHLHTFHYPHGPLRKITALPSGDALISVTTIRDPRNVAASWVRRYGTTDANRDWRSVLSLWAQYALWLRMTFDVTIKVEDPKPGLNRLSELTRADFGDTLPRANLGPKGRLRITDGRLDDLLNHHAFKEYYE